MLALVVGGLGLTGVLYLLLNLWWPGWYLDWYYHRNTKRTSEALMSVLMQKKFLIDIFEDFAKATPKKPFIIYNDKEYSYEYMDKRANQAGRAAVEIGIKPGTTVAVLMYNEPGIIWSYLGFMKIGYQIAFINFNLRAHSLSHSIKASGAKVLIIGQGDALIQAVMDILPEIPDVTVYVQGKPVEQKPPSFLSFDVVMSRMSTEPIDKSVRKHVLPFTPNVYIYTSGTTGLPKPAIRNHRSCVVSGHRYFDGMTKDDILYQTLPLYHSAALLVGFGKVLTSGIIKKLHWVWKFRKKSIIMDKFYYSSLPDISHKVKWPVKLVSSSRVRSDKVTVYCLSDDAYFDVSLNQLVNFPSSKISLKSKALLKKKPKTLESFIADEKWAKSEQVKAKKAHVSDRTEERSHEQNQSHSTLAYEENEKVQADEKLERIKNGRGHRLCTQKRKNEETSIERNEKRTLRKRINVGTVKKKCSETGKEQSEFTVTLETEAVQNVKEIELEQNKNHSTFVCEENEKTEVDKKSEGIDSARRQPCRQKRKNEDTGIHTNKKRTSGKRMGDRTVKQQCTETRNEQSEVTVTAETESVQNIDEKGHEQSQSYSTVVCLENESNSNVVRVENEKAEVDEKSEKINSGIGHGQCTQKRINADAKTDRIKNKMEHGQRELTVTTESDNVRNIEEREHKERDSIVCEEGEKQRLDERTEGTNIETLHVQSELIVAKKDADENTGEQEHWQSEKTVVTCEKDENDDKSEYEESLFDDVDNDKDFQPYSSESECSEEFSESELQPTTSRLALLSGSENRIEAVDDSTSDSDQSQVFPMLVRPFQRSIHDDDSSQMLLCQGTVHEKDSSPTLLYQGTLHKEDSSDTCSDDDIFSEADVVRDEFRPGIYIRKVVKSESSKTGRRKKSDRVYNSRNVCPFCLKKQTNFSHHIFSKKHENEKEVRRIIKISQELDGPNYMKKKKTAIEMLRMSGNHMHNMKVIEKMKGELILARRNSSTYFNHKEYGPCPTCFGWMLYKTFRRHSKTCPGNICNNNSDNGSVSMSAVALAVQSDILTGRISKHASKALVSEVFSIMQDDEVSRVAQSDSLIVSLGNQWLKRNMGNRIMRKYYTSQVMRLAARLLIELKKGAVNGENSLEQFLSPPYFTAVAEAALVCAKQNLNDDENLASPSNAVKLGYDIKRMASAKLANAIVEKNEIARREGKDFLSLMNMEWGFRVKKQAVVLLTERQFNKKTALPLPADIKVLAQHMDDTLKTFNCDDVTQSNFRLAATYALAKLTLYNRRRSHEVQALRVATYKQKISGFDQVSVDLFHQLSAWEKQLIETQDVVEIRGKRGRRVPVIIPQQVKVVMEYLVCPRVREAAGVPSVNPYVFASGVGVVRAYDAIRKVTSSGGLEMPSLIRTTNMRKFMATMIQADRYLAIEAASAAGQIFSEFEGIYSDHTGSLETTETQRQWIIDHLGHNMDIHLTYYRQQSDIIERVEVAKLLLIQDLKKSKEFAGKKLEEIQIEDIFTPENIPTEDNTLDEHETTVIPDLYSFEEEEESRLGGHTLAKRHPANPVKRQRWSSEDEEELKKLFTVNFESLKCPNTKDIKIAVKKSLKSNGSIHKRTIENIKKKVSNMLIKLRK